ncbi:uncharacterized protein LOC105202287 isoform X2 [Solenopsis invicta]|uniref:uncharacterized protein LOC105202287 isoform X2 n=1 Tax=Solenopsis invicta TaxID=13686 RepID=UPI000595CAC7|nr:uncharacterized protein LOC105202287 isoform X2 [Solenopsis invicta]
MSTSLIEKYYNNPGYELSDIQTEASIKIVDLAKNSKLKGDKFVNRLCEATQLMTTHCSDFQSICNHQDVPWAIIDYMSYFQTNIFKTCTPEKEEMWSIMLTLLNFCARQEVQSFLETYLVKHSSADDHVYEEYKKLKLSNQTIEMILFEDADLYAVVSYLKISDNSRNLSKIWIPSLLKYEFLSLKDRYFKNLHSDICIFQFKQELLTSPTFYKINVTSIWSENIAAAKSLAASLDRNIILVNTLDLYDSAVIMPYTEIFKILLPHHRNLNEDQQIINTIKPINNTNQSKKKTKANAPADPVPPADSDFNLMFYDGTWQKPLQNTYWTYKNTPRANATSNDISRCVASARKGFKIWSALSTGSRMQALSKFALALERASKPKLSKIVIKWMKFPHWYQNLSIPKPKNSLLTKTYKPKGVITLMEMKEMDLFQKLTQSLIIGNSVIVVCTAKSCNIAEYCEMFSTSGIPPGTVNLLSCENVKLLSKRYNAVNLIDMYRQFTVSKQVVTMI